MEKPTRKTTEQKKRTLKLREACVFDFGAYPMEELYLLALQVETRYHLSSTRERLRKWFGGDHPTVAPLLHLLAFADVISRRHPDISFRDAALSLAKVDWL